jgi:hypothetical protein
VKERENDWNSNEIQINLLKIRLLPLDVENVVIFFPYNQKDLFVPSKTDWIKITKEMGYKSLLIVSPNALVMAKPIVFYNRLIITKHEMILNYWREIQLYLEANQNIRCIKVISCDIDKERIQRDYSIIFAVRALIVEYETIIVSNSIWKKIYQIREKLVLSLPIWFYRQLGKSR